MLQHYQLLSGFSQPVLEKTNAIPWSTEPWVDSLRSFLHRVKGQIILPPPWLPCPHRQHDATIMEDIMALNLPKAKAIQVNSVRTYLKVNFLSEITDHSGMHLLPQALFPQQSQSSFFHDNPNHSTLYWPQQTCPGNNAWKQWKDIVLWMYAKPNSTDLLKPLGSWNHHYTQDYSWNWTVNPQTQQLFHRYQNMWHTYLPKRRRPTEIIYPLQPRIHREAPVNTVPTMPQIVHNRIHLRLLLSDITQVPAPPVPAVKTLIQKLTAPPDNWEHPLWHQIQPNTNLGTLKLAILNRDNIIIVSDASVSPQGNGSCAWTIWANRHLWQGIGYVPGPNLEMYSGLAEAYGLHMALSFFQRYLATFPLVLPPHLITSAYCDNKGIVDRLNRKANQQYPRDTIQDDYPIIGEIQQTIRNLEPILVTIAHVKGHQDKVKLDRPLTIQETLNIDCDKRASEAMTNFPNTAP